MNTSHVCSIIMILTDLCMVIPCFYYSCSLDWKPKDHRPFMVFLPPEALTMDDFSEILLNYKKKIVRLTWAEIILLPVFWFPDVMGQLLLITAVIFSYLLLPPVFGRKARAELLALKKEKHWVTEYTAVHHIDMRLGGKTVKKRTHMVLFFLGIVVLFMFVCYEVFYLKALPPFSILVGIIVFEITVFIAMFWQRRRYRTWREEVLHPDDFYSGDEDDYWHIGKFGLYYDNPYDPVVMKNNNSGGLNMNLNRARLGSWIFWAVVWVTVSIPLVYYLVYPGYVDRAGQLVDIWVTEDSRELLIDGRFYHAALPLEGLADVQLISDIKDLGDGKKLNGTGTFAYGKGRFQYENCGKTINYAAYRHPPFLLFTVGEGDEAKTYLVNDDDPQNTEAVYQKLCGILPHNK